MKSNTQGAATNIKKVIKSACSLELEIIKYKKEIELGGEYPEEMIELLQTKIIEPIKIALEKAVESSRK